jgi:hypothetical protein
MSSPRRRLADTSVKFLVQSGIVGLPVAWSGDKKGPSAFDDGPHEQLVGVAGFELATPCTPSKYT